MRARLLVVDDDPGVVEWLVEALGEEGYRVEGCTDPHAAVGLAVNGRFDLVVSDVEMPGLRGLDLLRAIHDQRPGQLVVLMTAFGSIDLAVRAVRAGASDFVTKPFRIEVLVLAIERTLQERRMRREIVRLRQSVAPPEHGGVVARSPSMLRLLELANRSARSTATVLLTGESGVGKGTIAQYIHERSDRASKPFVQVNCAALPGPLVESELFGVRRGAFTDARETREGLFVEADGGTLFLDEIAEMPLESQPKLLQALEERRIRPLGGSQDRPVDVRLIAATNRPLEDALRDRRLRPDLYYRLNVVRLEIPPLRERPEDVEGLVDTLLARHAQALGREMIGVSEEAMRWLRAHPWPGNVRELSNLLQRAVALSEHDTIVLEDLVGPSSAADDDVTLSQAARAGRSLEEIERWYIDKVLEATGGNKSRAAKILGIDRRTLYRKTD